MSPAAAQYVVFECGMSDIGVLERLSGAPKLVWGQRPAHGIRQ